MMRLDGFGILVKDMGAMIRFYRDVLGFEIKEAEDTANVFLEKDGTLFLLFGRKDFEQMTSHKYGYAEGENGHFEIALSVENYAEVDKAFAEVVAKGAKPILEPFFTKSIHDFGVWNFLCFPQKRKGTFGYFAGFLWGSFLP